MKILIYMRIDFFTHLYQRHSQDEWPQEVQQKIKSEAEEVGGFTSETKNL